MTLVLLLSYIYTYLLLHLVASTISNYLLYWICLRIQFPRIDLPKKKKIKILRGFYFFGFNVRMLQELETAAYNLYHKNDINELISCLQVFFDFQNSFIRTEYIDSDNIYS